MSAETKFRSPRLADRQIIDGMREILLEVELGGPTLHFVPFHGAQTVQVALEDAEKNEMLNAILAQKASVIQQFELIVTPANQRRRGILRINRKGEEFFDEVTLIWDPNYPVISESDFAKIVHVAKKAFKEVKLDGSLAGFTNKEINKYYEARDATITRLESINQELLFGLHKRQLELDQVLEEKKRALNDAQEAKLQEFKDEFATKQTKLEERAAELEKRQADFDMRESKYLRRQLRQDMLTKLENLGQKFELTKGTRRLRWPIAAFALLLAAFFATMTVLAFNQTAAIVAAAGQDLTKLNWWQLGFLGLKQLGFAAAFLGVAWYYIKWNDRWFRQHADAEFMFKQMDLDVNRASWVVELALEWKDEQGREIPPELLERLTRNLFRQSSTPEDEDTGPTDVASILLGSASNLKVKAPTGAELEFDRKGLQRALRSSEE